MSLPPELVAEAEQMLQTLDQTMGEIGEMMAEIDEITKEDDDDIASLNYWAKEEQDLRRKLDHKIHEQKVMIFKTEKQKKRIDHLQSELIEKDEKIVDLMKRLMQSRNELHHEKNEYLALQRNYDELQQKAEIPEEERLVFDNRTNKKSDDEFEEDAVERVIKTAQNIINGEDSDEEFRNKVTQRLLASDTNHITSRTQNNQHNHNKPSCSDCKHDENDDIEIMPSNHENTMNLHHDLRRDYVPQRAQQHNHNKPLYTDEIYEIASNEDSDLVMFNHEDTRIETISSSSRRIPYIDSYGFDRDESPCDEFETESIEEYEPIKNKKYLTLFGDEDTIGTRAKKHKRRQQSEFMSVRNENRRREIKCNGNNNSNSSHNVNNRKWTKKEEDALVEGVKKYRKRYESYDNVFNHIYKKKRYQKIWQVNNRSITMMREKWQQLDREHKLIKKWDKEERKLEKKRRKQEKKRKHRKYNEEEVIY